MSRACRIGVEIQVLGGNSVAPSGHGGPLLTAGLWESTLSTRPPLMAPWREWGVLLRPVSPGTVGGGCESHSWWQVPRYRLPAPFSDAVSAGGGKGTSLLLLMGGGPGSPRDLY